MRCISCHLIPLKPLTLRMDHGKLLEVRMSLPVSNAILSRAACFAMSRPANHAICSYIDSGWICIWIKKMFIYRIYNNGNYRKKRSYRQVSIKFKDFSKLLQKTLLQWQMSHHMRFPTMWYVRPAKAQTSLRIHAVWSEPLLVAWILFDC